MQQAVTTILADDEVSPEILRVIREANKYVTLVSPYNKFWGHLKLAIQAAIQRGVQLTVVCREDEKGSQEAIHWLGREGATVYAVERLHAKLMLNESAALVTSMNLLESSAQNSKEVAVLIRDGAMHKELCGYVNDRLIAYGSRVYPASSQPANPSVARAKPHPSPAVIDPKKGGPRPSRGRKLWKMAKVLVTGGRCIRCDKAIEYNPERPLCGDCFKVWNQHKNPSYAEVHCHRCGKESQTSLIKPLCRSCYQETTSR
ncbi:MAG: phospholipase D-like domain-containing protein [Dehalococcoidia bacterium]